MSAMQCQYRCSGPSTDSMNYITGNVFGKSFHFDWQIDSGFQKNPIMAHTLISKYTGGAQNKDFSTVSQKDLTRGLVSSVSQATYSLT